MLEIGWAKLRPGNTNSSLTRLSSISIGLNCGPEIGVAATKSFVASLGIQESSDLNLSELNLKIRIATETGDRLIAFAYSQATAEERARVIAEMKQLLAGYLFV